MRVIITPSEHRVVSIEATLDQLAELYQATRRGRRTRAEMATLEAFGDALYNGDQDLRELVRDAAPRADNEGEGDEPS